MPVATDNNDIDFSASAGSLTAALKTEGARVYRTTDQSVSAVTESNITFDAERYDTNGLHSTSTNTGRLTAQQGGIYLIAATVSFAANATGFRALRLLLNGGTRIAEQRTAAVTDSGFPTVLTVSTVWQLSAGDYVTAAVYQNSGGSLAVQATGSYSPEFMMQRLRG